MPVEVILPRVDMDMTTGRISAWHVAEGDAVAKGQVIFEIETDKAAMEIDAPVSGVIGRLTAASGEAIPVGTVVAMIYAEGETVGAPPPAAPAAAAAPATAATAAASATAAAAPATAKTSAALATAATSAASAAAAIPAASAAAAIPAASAVTPSLPAASAAPPSLPASSPAPSLSDGGPAAAGLRATPLARSLARAAGIDLSRLTGTGPRGRVQRCDVEAAIAADAAQSSGGQALPRPGAAAMSRGDATLRAPGTLPQPQATGTPLPVASAATPQGLEAPRPAAGAARAAASQDQRGAGGLRWLRQGAGDPLLLLHGFGAETGAWRGLMPLLPEGLPVCGIDLPGHGTAAGVAADGFEGLLAHAGAVLAAAGVTRLHLCGHSLGGAVATALAGGGGIEARSLTLLAPAGFSPGINAAWLDGFCGAEQADALGVWMRELVSDPDSLPPALVTGTLRLRQEGGLGPIQSRLARRLFPGGTQVFSVRAALARHSGPQRVILGLADRILPGLSATAFGPATAVHLLPGVGHLPQAEAPALVARLMLETLRSA